jgi:hypothetical protein
MADELEPQASRRYRELGSEEPPPALDHAILAASRRAVAPRRRWYIPLAAAAVAVLAVGVALHVERQQPDPQAVTAPSELPRETKQQRGIEDSAPGARDARVEERASARPMQEAPPPPAAAPAPIPQTAPVPQSKAQAAKVRESPERWLERIAGLRRAGRHGEADKALAEFRTRYPDYRIPEEVRAKVERR